MSNDSYEKALNDLCQVQPGDTELMLVGREFARKMKELGPTEDALREVLQENIRLESSLVNLRAILGEVLKDED